MKKFVEWQDSLPEGQRWSRDCVQPGRKVPQNVKAQLMMDAFVTWYNLHPLPGIPIERLLVGERGNIGPKQLYQKIDDYKDLKDFQYRPGEAGYTPSPAARRVAPVSPVRRSHRLEPRRSCVL